MTCLHCGTSLADKRQGAKFCCPQHRKNYHKRLQSQETVKRHPNKETLKETLNSEHVQVRFMVTRDFFRSRTGRAGLGRDYADLRQALARYSREILIQEIIAYRADLDDLREELTFKEVA